MKREPLPLMREKDALLIAAQRLTGAMPWSFDLQSQTFDWPEESYRALGLRGPERRQRTLTEFLEHVHPDDRKQLRDVLRRACRAPRTFDYRCRLVGPKGRQRLMRAVGVSLVNETGTVHRIVGTVVDATEHEQLRRAVETKEARLRALTDSSHLWLWEQDAEFRFTSVTEGPGRAFGIGPEFGLGRRRWEMPDCLPVRGSWDDHRQCCEARKPFRDFRYRVGTGAAAQVFSTTGLPVYSPEGEFLGYGGTATDVTQLEKAEMQAEQSDALLRVATRIGRVGAFAVTLPAMQVTWSSDFLKLHDFGPNVALTIEDAIALIDPHSQCAVRTAFRDCARDGAPFDLEVRTLSARGNSMWIRIAGEAVRNAAGDIVRVDGAVQDITDCKNATEHLRRVSEELTTTLESVTDACIMVNRETRFTYVNSEAERVLGKPRSELIGRLLPDVFPGGGGAIRQEMYKALAEGGTRRIEAFSAEVGKWVKVVIYPSAQGVVMYARDITESRNAKQALLESEERHRLLFQNSGEAIIEAGPDWKIQRANRAACALFKRSEPELCTLFARELGARSDERVDAVVQEHRRCGVARGELTLVRGDNSTFEAEVASSTYESSKGSISTTIVIRDITERLQAQQTIHALNADLSERVRARTSELEVANNELRSFAHSLAHDLRTPIAAIKGFSRALDESLAAAATGKERHYSTRILAAAQRMDDYVEALLSLARTTQATLSKTEVDLSALAIAILDELQQREPARRVERHIQQGLRAVGDGPLLRALLENLLGNAWKFTGRQEVALISLSATTDGDGQVVYSVRDNGAGFDMAWAGKLFGTFQRLHTDSEFSGTGVGLANVLRVVTRHGGRVWAQSAVGEGATFSFTLAAARMAGNAACLPDRTLR